MSLKQRKLQRELLQANHTISAKQARIAEKSRSFSNNLQIVKDDAERVVSIMDNAPSIVHNIDTQFEMATSLKKKDIAFLFAAAAIQVARWALLPAFDFTHELTPSGERMSALEGGKIEQAGITEYLKNQGFSDAEIRMLMPQMKLRSFLRTITLRMFRLLNSQMQTNKQPSHSHPLCQPKKPTAYSATLSFVNIPPTFQQKK